MQNIHLGGKTTGINYFKHNFDGSVNAISLLQERMIISTRRFRAMTDKQDRKTVILKGSGD